MDKYLDRYHAGEVLADQLTQYIDNPNVIVLGLPRGGVPVAAKIAEKLHAPLDVFIVRKLGVPTHEELAFGALAVDGTLTFNQDILDELSISPKLQAQVITKEKEELIRRNQKYRGNKSFPSLKNKIVILVDDGIATGATMRVALTAIRKSRPEKIIVAVPVAAKSTVNELKSLADEIICPMTPEFFYAVGAWYEVFDQTEDEEVFRLLKN